MIWNFSDKSDTIAPRLEKTPPLQHSSDDTAVKILPHSARWAGIRFVPPALNNVQAAGFSQKLPELSLHRWLTELEIDGEWKGATTKMK